MDKKKYIAPLSKDVKVAFDKKSMGLTHIEKAIATISILKINGDIKISNNFQYKCV